MKIKKLSSDLIAVFLSEQDMVEYDINITDKIPQSDELHRFLFEIMEVIKAETGFDPYHGGQVVVEASPVPSGMNLLISKVRTEKKKTLTREQFNRVRKVSVVRGNGRKKQDLPPSEYVKHIIEELGLTEVMKDRKNEKAKNRAFIFNSFTEWENAFCRVSPEVVSGFSLYRSGVRYALITDLEKENIYYNVLSEFALVECVKNVTILNIKEGWHFIADGKNLVKMCEAVKTMQ